MEAQLLYLRSLLEPIHDLNHAAAVLEWDQETYMPDGAVEARAHQIATLRRLAHERFTTDEIGRLLDELQPQVSALESESTEAALVRVTRRDYERAIRLPSELVTEISEAVSLGQQAWKKARQTNHFPTFAPHLERLIDLNIRKAEAYGFDDRIYDALLEEYEPGMRTREVERVFADLRADLVPIVQAIAERDAVDDSALYGGFDGTKQWDFGMEVLRDFGYDFERGRQDISTHPFSTAFSITDVRITTRVDENYLPSALFSTMHEAGHALYEQGIDPELERGPLADGTSLAMHESQSRLWENLVGRSRPFWEHYYPRLQRHFPEQLSSVPLDTFYRAVNRVAPSLIRVEADEVTYNLHIMLRFELENEILEGRVRVAELPERWNEAMEQYLGIRPERDADGILQDVHWSLGAFGYFPTYALGTLMSAQLFARIRDEIAGLDAQIAAGRFDELLGWLRSNIHRYGRRMTAGEILERTTGQPLTAEPWLAYVRSKFGTVYDF